MSISASTLVVTAKTRLAEGLVELRLRHPGGERLPDWTPGAHIDLVLGEGAVRQYSLCGSPRDTDEYSVAVRREADGRGGSAYVHDSLQVGDTVGFGGPRNNFALVPSPRYAFIAGGIGITPILPMIRQAEELGLDWRMLYLGRSREGAGYLDELVEYGDRVAAHFSAEAGRVDLPGWIGGFDADVKLYACGPAELLTAVEQIGAEWRPGWMRIERFVAEIAPSARSTPFEVELARSNRVVVVDPGTSITAAVRDAGGSILTSCATGLCGTCETAVIAGTPDHRDSILDEAERRDGRCLMPCVSRSLSDRLVLDL